MTPMKRFALLPHFATKDYGAASTLLMFKKKSHWIKKKTFKDSIHATNHSHAMFMTKELLLRGSTTLYASSQELSTSVFIRRRLLALLI